MVPINATRWLDLSSLHDNIYQRKDILIPAGTDISLTHLLTYLLIHSLYSEPTYLCARSTNWQKQEQITEVPFNVTFQPGVIRDNDQRYCAFILYFFLFVLFLLASSWLLPYVISLICYYLRYLYYSYSWLLSHSPINVVTKKH